MFDVSEVNMMHVLDEVVAAIESPLRFGLAPALLIFVASHVGVIRMGLTAEWTGFEYLR